MSSKLASKNLEIKPYDKNAKKHPDVQLKQIVLSLKEYGWRQPIVTDKHGTIIVGHGRYLAYQKFPEGISKPWIIVADDLTPEQVRGYRLMDNKTNESDWDMALAIEELKELDQLGFDIDLTGFDKDLLIEPDEKDDVIPENPPPVAKLGDLWALGEHRVLCGDSTDAEDVSRLMDGKKADVVVTDPPYNTGMGGKNATFDYDWSKQKKNEKARLSHMFDDNFTEEEWTAFLHDFFAMYYSYTKGDCAFYVFIDWRRVSDIRGEMEKLMDVKNVIVWDKQMT